MNLPLETINPALVVVQTDTPQGTGRPTTGKDGNVSRYKNRQLDMPPGTDRPLSKKYFFANPNCNGILNVRRLFIYLIIYDIGYRLQKLMHTVKSSNVVTLTDENIFFRKTFLTSPHNFFWY
jgi:hypothetical protein